MENLAGYQAGSLFTSSNICYFRQVGWQTTVVEGDVAVHQRMIGSTFKNELSRKSVLSYLAPIFEQRGEAYGLIAITKVQFSVSNVVMTFIWLDFETAMSA